MNRILEKQKRNYLIISILLFFASITVLAIIDKTNNIKLSLTIQIIMILYLAKIAYGCLLYIRQLYDKRKYSYSIIMNLGLFVFIVINLFRQINLLIVNWNITSINELYNNTLNSFSYFALLILPFIIALAIYCIITNIVLIKKEGFRIQNLLGIMFGIMIFLGVIGSQFIYDVVRNINLSEEWMYIKKFIDIALNASFCYFYCLTLSTLYCNIMAAKHKPYYDKDFIIILGAKIRDDGTLTPLVKARVDKAIIFAKEQQEKEGKSIIFIPSGGQGKDEIMSEANAMKNYLIKNGINEENIVIEDKSVNTLQNLTFSKQKIDEINKDGKIIFSTTNYHVFRSGVIANKEGIDCEGIGSKTKWYFYINALLREFGANLVDQRKKHIGLITLINACIFILVIIGYHFKLL